MDEEQFIEAEIKEASEDGILSGLEVILPTGEIKKRHELDKEEHAHIEKVIATELGELSEAHDFETPPHLKYMRSLEIAEPEKDVSDAGNLRYYPKGAFIAELLRELGWKMAVEDLGASPVNTPYIINPNYPAVKIMMDKFPERLYKVLPGKEEKKQEFRLRPACDYGVWSIFKDTTISYKNLPLGLYEFDIMWRYEQRGELLGMYRVRNAMMPNLHTMCADMNAAFSEFERHMDRFAVALYRYFDMEPSVIILNCKADFYNKHKNVFAGWAKNIKIPIIVKLFKTTTTYKSAWIDVIAFDNMGRPMELDTVQLDTESARWWNITYVDKDGNKQYPIILHTGFGVERAIATLLEHAESARLAGSNPVLPLWLSPTQVRIIPVSQDYVDKAVEVAKDLNSKHVRTDVDDKNQSVGKRIRKAELEWVPYIVVMGEKELNSNKINVRDRIKNTQEQITWDDLVTRIHSACVGLPYKPLPLPLKLSHRPIFVGTQ